MEKKKVEPRLGTIVEKSKTILQLELPSLSVAEPLGEMPPLPHICLGTTHQDGRWVLTCSDMIRKPRVVLRVENNDLVFEPKDRPTKRIPLPEGTEFSPTEQSLSLGLDGCGGSTVPFEAKIYLIHQSDMGEPARIFFSMTSSKTKPTLTLLGQFEKQYTVRCDANAGQDSVDIVCANRPICSLKPTVGKVKIQCGDDVATIFAGCQTTPKIPTGLMPARGTYN